MLTTYSAAQSLATVSILVGLAVCAFIILGKVGR